MELLDKICKPHNRYNCADYHEPPPATEDWELCPSCGLRPKVWEYDNGRETACGCWLDNYVYFSINAECIKSVLKRTNGETAEYDSSALRKNWNHWCKTGERLFWKQVNGRW